VLPAGTYRVIGEVWDPEHPAVRSTEVSLITSRFLVHGLDFGPYLGAESPDLGTVLTEEQIRERLTVIARHTKWIRTFGCDGGLEVIGRVAHELGLRCAVGIWLSRDRAANDVQIANAIAVALAGEADMLVVGSETLRRGDLDAADLISYIEQVRAAVEGLGIPVTTADVHHDLVAHPEVLAACDVVMPNYYPSWEGVPLEFAMAAVHGWHQRVVSAAGGKPVIVSETGWPSLDSVADAARYFLEFVSWARANEVDYFYFEARNEPWKIANEGPLGATWGLWDDDGNLKPGMAAVFLGETSPDTWTSPSIPGGPGTPTLEFTRVPELGSDDDLYGQVWHADPDEHYVAVYIRVAGGWWTKPTFADPRTDIAVHGAWATDVTTGGSDPDATRIEAFLLPSSYDPPAAAGESSLSSGLYENAVATAAVDR
jgi:exo-beta-1,3-glucanase (GH17 family)